MNDKSRYLPGLMPLPQKLKITGGENADTAKAEVSFKKSSAIPREGYRLEFDGRSITIEYSDESGRAYAEAAAAALKRAKSAPRGGSARRFSHVFQKIFVFCFSSDLLSRNIFTPPEWCALCRR